MISLDYWNTTEPFKVVCPYCGEENEVKTDINTGFGYENDIMVSIEDFNFSCNHCKSEMIVCPEKIELVITESKVKKIKEPIATLKIDDKIFLKEEEKILTVVNVELLYNKVWVYILSNNEKYTYDIYKLKGTEYENKVKHLYYGNHMKL